MNTKINSSPEMSTFLNSEPKQALKASTVITYNNIYEPCVHNSNQRRQTTPDDPIAVSPLDMVEDWLITTADSKPRCANTERSALLWALEANKPHGSQEAYARLRSIAQERVGLGGGLNMPTLGIASGAAKANTRLKG